MIEKERMRFRPAFAWLDAGRRASAVLQAIQQVERGYAVQELSRPDPRRAIHIVKPGGVLVSVVSQPPSGVDHDRTDIKQQFFSVEVTTERLARLLSFLIKTD